MAGLLSGLPVIAGPILWFIYIENGLKFAQKASVAEPLLANASIEEILFRMVFAFFLVVLVTRYALFIGTIYSGIFAAFPIAGSTIAIFSHRNYSANHAIRALKSMKQGLLSMLAFLYIISAYSDVFGFSVTILLAAVVALFLQAILIWLKKSFKSLLQLVR